MHKENEENIGAEKRRINTDNIDKNKDNMTSYRNIDKKLKNNDIDDSTIKELDRRKNNGTAVTNKQTEHKHTKTNPLNEREAPSTTTETSNAPRKTGLNSSLNNESLNNTTESDVLHLKGSKNTAKIRITTTLSDSGVRIIDDPPSLEQSLEDDMRLQVTNCRCMPKRYMLAILSFFGFFNVYCLRVDLSVALVAMTNNHTRVRYDGSEYWVAAEFEWGSQLQGHILAAFYYGYLVTQIPGGYIAARFGGKSLFGGAIFFSAVFTLLTPMACRTSWIWLFLIRFSEGLCEGCIYPAMYAMWSRWAPPLERARLVTIPHSGSYSGSVAGTLIAGYLCELCGWTWVFYLFGLIALIWVAVWQILASDSPEEDRHISSFERRMILESLQDDQTSHLVKGSPPWCQIFTSMPFLAILVAHTCEGWGFGTMQTGLPKYLSEAMNFRLSKTGEYTATLYLVMGITVLLSGQLADFVRQNLWLSATMARKSFTMIGFFSNCIAFIVSMHLYVPEAAIITIIIGAGVESLAWAGFAINHLDIAPRYASLLFGITNTFATIPNIVSPVFVGFVTNGGGREEWVAVFYISSFIFAFGAIFYGIFASAERQPWAEDHEKENTTSKEE